jgi:hypothetical protein
MSVSEVSEIQDFMFLCLFEKLFTSRLNRPEIGHIKRKGLKMRLQGSIKWIYL